MNGRDPINLLVYLLVIILIVFLIVWVIRELDDETADAAAAMVFTSLAGRGR